MTPPEFAPRQGSSMSEISLKVRFFGENPHYLNRLFLEKRLFKSIAYHYNAAGRTFFVEDIVPLDAPRLNT